MELTNEPRTLVYTNKHGQIVVMQPDECCIECSRTEQAFVYFSPERARQVAAEILRLADAVEAAE